MSGNRWLHPRSLAFIVVLALLFIWLAIAVSGGAVPGTDSVFRAYVHEHSSPELTLVMRGFSALGSLMFLIVAAAIVSVIFLRVSRRNAVVSMAWAMGGAIVLENILKYSIHRARPDPFFGAAPHTYSFPSGHALFSLCFYAVLASSLTIGIRTSPIRIIVFIAAAVLIAAIGLSRVYLGVHYPSDVLGGYVAAAWWLATLSYARDLSASRTRF